MDQPEITKQIKGDGLVVAQRLALNGRQALIRKSILTTPGHYYVVYDREFDFVFVSEYHDYFWDLDKFIEDQKDQAKDYLFRLVLRTRIQLGLPLS